MRYNHHLPMQYFLNFPIWKIGIMQNLIVQQNTTSVWHIICRIWHTCAKSCAIYDPRFEPHGTHGDHFLNLELDIFPKNPILRLCNLLNISYLCLYLSLHETIVSLSCALVCVQISLIIQDIFLLLYYPIIYVSGWKRNNHNLFRVPRKQPKTICFWNFR